MSEAVRPTNTVMVYKLDRLAKLKSGLLNMVVWRMGSDTISARHANGMLVKGATTWAQ